MATLGDTPLNTEMPAGGGGGSEPWEGNLVVNFGDGNPSSPDVAWSFQATAVSVAGPTPTQISATIGRLQKFRLKTAITVNRIRFFGLATVTGIYTMAIYNATTGARVWTQTVNVTAGWVSISAGLPITLAANTPYWFGLGANTTGTTAGFRSPASPIANSLGITTLPGNLDAYGNLRYAQVTLVAGAWPDPLPALAAAAFASAGSGGTIPVVFLDNSSA